MIDKCETLCKIQQHLFLLLRVKLYNIHTLAESFSNI